MEKFALLMAPVLMAALFLVSVMAYGSTAIRFVKDRSYRSAFLANVHSLGMDRKVEPNRETRRGMARGLGALFVMGDGLVTVARASIGTLRGVLRAIESRILVVRASEAGALTLAETAKLTQNDLQAGIAERFVIESVVLDQLPLKDIEGNADSYNEEATLPGVEFRAVNAAYTESTGTVNPVTENLVILGGDADADTFLIKTQGRTADGYNNIREQAERAKVKAAVYKFQDAFINGDTAVDPNSFDGLKKRLTGGQVIAAANDGMGPVTGGQDFLDALDALIDLVGGADALYMNRSIRSKIRSSARRLGSWDQSKDDFGRRIQTYNGIPLLDIGTKADGTQILPQTETQGASAVASSIYAVKFGEDEADGGVTGLQNGGLDVRDLGELDVKPVHRTRIEWFLGLALFSGKAAARLTGVLNS